MALRRLHVAVIKLKNLAARVIYYSFFIFDIYVSVNQKHMTK